MTSFLWNYAFLASCSLLAALAVGAAAWFWWRRRRLLRALPLLITLPLLGSCGLTTITWVRHDVQRVRLARQMGVELRDPRFTPMFPYDYLAAEDVLVRGRTTRAEVEALTRHAQVRYRCASGLEEAFFFYGMTQEDALVVAVRYDKQDHVEGVYAYNDSLRLFTDGCMQF